MAENQIELLIKARDEASRALDSITQKIAAMEGAAGGTSSGMEKLHEHMGNAERRAVSMSHGWIEMAKGMLAAQAVMAGFNLVYQATIGLFEKGIKSVDDLRVAQAAMASAAATNAPQRGWDEIFQTTGKIVEKVYELDRAFIGTGDELLILADSMVTFGMGIDLTTKKQQESFVGFANMLKMMTRGQDFQRQAFQEVRALMEGADVQGALLVKKLEAAGVNVKAMVPEWREQGILLEKIMEILPGYTMGSNEIERTLQAQKSSLETITFKILREGTAKAYEDIRNLVKHINDSLMDQNGLTEKGKQLVEILQLGWDAVKTAAVGTYNVFSLIVEKMEKMAANWQKIIEASGNYVPPIEGVVGTVTAEDLDAQARAQGRSAVTGKIADLLKAGKRAGEGSGDLKLPGGPPQISDAALKSAEKLQNMIEDMADKISVERARARGGEVEAAFEKARIDWINRNRAIAAAAEAAGKAKDAEAVDLAYRLSAEQRADDEKKAVEKRIDEETKLTIKWIVERGKLLDKQAEEDVKRQEKTLQMLDQYNEMARYASELKPRVWDVPGLKDQEKALHDLEIEMNKIDARERKWAAGDREGGASPDEASRLRGGATDVYQARLRQIADANDQAKNRIEALWADAFSAINNTSSNLFFDAFQGKLKSMGDYFNSFANEIALAWSRAMANMVAEWIQAQLRMSSEGSLVNTIGKYISGAFGMGGGGGEDWGVGFAPTEPFARGGVVSSPKLFRFARGVGMAGEAGAEGILPLKRTASGDLGVQIADGAGGAPQNFSIQIINETGTPARVRESKGRFNGQEYVITAWLDGYTRDLFGMRTAMGR